MNNIIRKHSSFSVKGSDLCYGSAGFQFSSRTFFLVPFREMLVS